MTTLSAQVEDYLDVLPELIPLYMDHWRELALNTDKVPLAPDYGKYEMLHAKGILMLVTLRDAGRLVGYYLGFVQRGLHYSTCLEATMDIYRVLPEVRGRHGGVRLFRAVRRELERRGVDRWSVGSKLHRDTGRLFKALGFTPVETYHQIWLGK